jgi:hypothetical protein
MPRLSNFKGLSSAGLRRWVWGGILGFDFGERPSISEAG